MTDSRPFPGAALAPRRSRVPGFLALVVVTVVIAGFAWKSWQDARQWRELRAEQAAWREEVRGLHRQAAQAADERQALQRQMAQQQVKLDALGAMQDETRQRQWLVQEVAFYLNLAEDHLQLQQDAESALRLLAMADSLLESRQDSQLVPLRAALANDRLALAAAGQLDKAGISLRIDALKQASAQLTWPLQAGPARPATAVAANSAAKGLWEKGWRSFRELLVIRHYDHPVRPTLNDDQRWLLQQNVYLELTQAQLALWRNQGGRFHQSLGSVRRLLDAFGHPTGQAPGMNEELAALDKITLPDIPLTLPQSRKAVTALMQLQSTGVVLPEASAAAGVRP